MGKYHCILNVFRKARILEVEDGHKYRRFVAGEVPFADKNCILFDYSAMHAFSEKTYKSLDKNYKKAFYLYKHSYEAFTDGQKLQKAIESGSTEFGMTSSGKAICRVNDYLHFLLGNGIIADVFSEYRSAVKNLMSLLVYKYSTQGKKVLHEQPFPFIDGNDVYFDEIDFHCFIEYFDAKEIIALLSKYHIETIEFQNMASIENAVNNLLDYYSYAVKSSKNNIDVARVKRSI